MRSPVDIEINKYLVVNLVGDIQDFFSFIKKTVIYILEKLNIIKQKKIIISIEGNIGSGKSTLIDILKNEFPNEIYFADEPVNEWTNIGEHNLLNNFYNDKKRWSYTFQNYAFITRINNLKKGLNSDKKFIITERSIFTDKNVFAKMLYDDSEMAEMEYLIYNKWFGNFSIEIDKIIYVKTTVDNCNKRINTRNRKGEDKIEYEYLENLDKYHNTWINSNNNKLIIDGNDDFINDTKIREKYINNIHKFIKQ